VHLTTCHRPLIRLGTCALSNRAGKGYHSCEARYLRFATGGKSKLCPFSSPVLGRQSQNCGDFQRFFQDYRRVFSTFQTVWRSRQSGANLSLPKFPANREFNRESCKFWGPKTALLISKLYISEEKQAFRHKSEQGICRNVSGNRIQCQILQIIGLCLAENPKVPAVTGCQTLFCRLGTLQQVARLLPSRLADRKLAVGSQQYSSEREN
jgi:hypothetical protein